MVIFNELKDCGCSESQCKEYNDLRSKGEKLKFLKIQRKSLMDDMHTAQKRVDCIDYIIRKIEED